MLGSPVAFVGGPALINAEMSTRARKAFHANKKMFLAKTGIRTRLKAHNMVVREAGLWGSPTWPVNDSILRTANGIQLHHTRDMLKIPRTPGESWVDWNTRSLRQARIALVKFEIPRWSTRILEAMWNLWRHVGRAATGEAGHGGYKRKPSQTKLEPDMRASSTQDWTCSATSATQRAPLLGGRSQQTESFGSANNNILSNATTPLGRVASRAHSPASQTSRPEQTHEKEATEAKHC